MRTKYEVSINDGVCNMIDEDGNIAITLHDGDIYNVPYVVDMPFKVSIKGKQITFDLDEVKNFKNYREKNYRAYDKGVYLMASSYCSLTRGLFHESYEPRNELEQWMSDHGYSYSTKGIQYRKDMKTTLLRHGGALCTHTHEPFGYRYCAC